MSRAAVVYKEKEELLSMNSDELKLYIGFLDRKIKSLGGDARKYVEKRAEVARKILNSLPS